MNKMKEVTKLLGVELYEEFAIEEEYGTRFRLTNSDLESSYDTKHWGCCGCLTELLTGKFTIRKLPWKPKLNESYYIPCLDKSGFDCIIFSDDDFDKFCVSHGIAFKTKEEAIKLTNYLFEQVKKYREE